MFCRPKPPILTSRDICAHVISFMATLIMRSARDLSSDSICEMTSGAEKVGEVPRMYISLGAEKQFLSRKQAVCRGIKSSILQSYLTMLPFSVKTDGNAHESRANPSSVASSAAMRLIPGHTFKNWWNISLKLCPMTVRSHFDAFSSRPILFALSGNFERFSTTTSQCQPKDTSSK